MTHTCYLGDSTTLTIPLTWEGAPFTPGGDWAGIFTAKFKSTDADLDAAFQHASGGNLSFSGAHALLRLDPADTGGLAPVSLICDVQVQHATSGAIRTVALDRLKLLRDITREVTTSRPPNNTEVPMPFGTGGGGGATPLELDEVPVDGGGTSLTVEASGLPVMTFSGVVTLADQAAGHGRYTAGGGIPDFDYEGLLIQWENGTGWVTRWWDHGMISNNYYYSAGDVATPDLVETWLPHLAYASPGENPWGIGYNVLSVAVHAGTVAEALGQLAVVTRGGVKSTYVAVAVEPPQWLALSGSSYTAGSGIALAGNSLSFEPFTVADFSIPPVKIAGLGTAAFTAAAAYAKRRSYQDASFTAAAYGRYHTSGEGIVVGNPETGALGEIFDVVIASGTAVVNGVMYAASRFPVEVVCTVAGTPGTWVTPAARVSDTLTVGANTWNGSTITGDQTFSSATLPTSSGSQSPLASSLVTRRVASNHAYLSRRLFGNCSGTTGGGGSGATSRRSAAQGLFDGDLSTVTTSGAFYKIIIGSGSTSSLMGTPNSGSVHLSAPWSMFLRCAVAMGTGSHVYLCIGGDGVSGIPSSGTSVGMEITSPTAARLYRCNGGAAVYSASGAISGITTPTIASDLFLWVDYDGAGNLSLYFAEKPFSSAMPGKPSTAMCSLSGVATNVWTGTDVALYLRATVANPQYAALVMRDVTFTEY